MRRERKRWRKREMKGSSTGTRVEHYEIAGYQTAISLAERIKINSVVTLLQQSLAEELAAEHKLRKIAVSLKIATPAQPSAA